MISTHSKPVHPIQDFVDYDNDLRLMLIALNITSWGLAWSWDPPGVENVKENANFFYFYSGAGE